jgi:rubrerythrin
MPENVWSRALGQRFLDRLAASRRGRAFMLEFLVGAEEADEAGVFDRLLARVDDPELHGLVRRHRDDETRHAALFRECWARQQVAQGETPRPESVIAYIDRALDGFAESFVRGHRGVMEAYVLLQVIEERGVARYPLIADAMARFDPESAAVIRGVAQDEIRHVKYAKAISRRYAPDAPTLAATLVRFRAAEARAFTAHSRAFLAQAVTADLLAVGRIERLAWRALTALEERVRSAAGRELLPLALPRDDADAV